EISHASLTLSHGVSKRKRTSEALWAKGLRMTSLEAARRSLGASAPETALREAKEVADAARGSGDHLLLAEAVSLQALCLLSSPVAAQQLLEAELGKARDAGHRPAELLLLGAASSAALARSDASSAKRAAAEGLELGRKLGSAFQAENRKPLQQLLLALANAELVLGHCPEAAAATCEALAKSSDESAEGEALHVACLMQMFFGRSAANKALAAAAKGVPPLSSLESCNRAATLFRKLGNQEGEACALLGIAEARSDSQVEALGAARRALDLFRSLRHRRGRLAALQLAASAQKETLAQLDTTEEELRLFEAENDTAGQVAALRILGDFYISAGIYGEARSAFRKSLALLKGLDACETEVQHLLLLSQVEELMGAHEAAERAAQSALALAKRAPSASAELPAARRTASRLAAAQGRAPEAPNRQMALEELRQLTDAARRRDGEAFRKTMARLEVMKATLLVLMSWAASGASDMEPLPLSTARRLLDLTVDATCLSSCSGLDTLITELTNFTQQLPRRATVNDMTGGMLDVMCSHNTAVTCMSNQCTVASLEATMSSTNMTAVLEAVCPVIGPLECAATSSACAPVVVKTAGATNNLATTTYGTAQISMAALAAPGIAAIAGMLIVM
ncbi:unnamed protein product, partial [Effrenium voratum]